MSEEDNRRQVLIIKLANGSATQQERDEATAMVLMSLWTEKELDERIDKRLAMMASPSRDYTEVLKKVLTTGWFWVFASVLALAPNTPRIIDALVVFFK